MPTSTALDSIELEVRDLIAAVPARAKQEGWRSDRLWTAEVVRSICETGRRRGYESCAHGWAASVGQGEWLYDSIWLDIKGPYLVEVPLVLESEWGLDGKAIEDDFLKLLLARAAHRVMVFQQRNADDVQAMFGHLTRIVVRNPVTGTCC
jgi:hypothetical protein